LIADRIDATLLKAGTTLEEFDLCIQKAVEHRCRALVLPTAIIDDKYVDAQRVRFQGGIKLCTVVGFPLGHNSIAEKLDTMKRYARYVDEFDVVVNLTGIRSGYFETLQKELEWIGDPELSPYPYKIKLIIETPLLTSNDIFQVASIIAVMHDSFPQISHIKTATGFNGKTEPWQVQSIRSAIPIEQYPNLNIKVSGGVRTLQDIETFDPYGVDIYGVSYPYFEELIVEEQRKLLNV